MIKVTEKAHSEISKRLGTISQAADKSLRLYVAGENCCGGPKYGMALDQKKDDDHVVNCTGFDVLVSAADAESLKGIVIDFISTPHGEGFSIDNPNARQDCGGCEGHAH